MHSHLDIEIDGKSLTLPDDFSISIEERNPLFNDTEMFSLPVPIPLDGNRELVENIDTPQADKRPIDMEHLPVRIIADGMPFKSGNVSMTEDEEIGDSITLNVDASDQSFKDLIGDLECRDVTKKITEDRIQVGEKIGNVKVEVKYKYKVNVTYQDGKKDDSEYVYDSEDAVSGTFEPQALGFSCPGICEVKSSTTQEAVQKTTRNYPDGHQVIVPNITTSFINVADAYPTMPYCNARIAYMHHGLNEDGTTSDGLIDISKAGEGNVREDHWPYWVLDADRPQSGLCFYILYFLECVFEELGVSYDLSALTAIEDFKHLCFFTTHHKYNSEIADYNGSHGATPFFSAETNTSFMREKSITLPGPMGTITSKQWSTYTSEEFNQVLFADINKWLSSRGCGGQLTVPYPSPKQVQDFTFSKNGGAEEKIVIGVNDVSSISIETEITYGKVTADIMAMYANADNFPDASVSSILESLESSFGIRFHYDYEQKKVTAYLMRDVFRSSESPIDFLGKVRSMNKMTEKITGVRMAYSAESDSKEQRKNVKRGVKDYDTDYDYVDYPEDSTITNLTYAQITQTEPVENLTTYVDKTTGNTYRWKASAEALDAGEYKVSLFQVATFKGVELGKCDSINEDFVKEFISKFTPVPFNDVNYRISELLVGNGNTITSKQGDDTYSFSKFNGDYSPLLSAYLDENMEHEFVAQYINNGLPSAFANLYLTEQLKTVESYDPSQTDDGNSPLQTYDWGMAIALMQGGGTNATTQHYDYNYDGFGNSRWRMVPGEYALTSDSLDLFGNSFDYNGDRPDDGGGERFSLKIRSWQQPSWADEPLVENDLYNDAGEVIKKIRTRGLCDSFMTEYFEWLLNRKKFKVRIEATVAELNDITNHWDRRYRINGQVGWIGKINYDLTKSEGVQDAELEFYSL